MRKSLVLVFLSCSVGAATSDRNVWDLQYLPLAKTIFGQTSYTTASGEIDGRGSELDISGFTVQQTAGFAFSDRILASATIMNSSLELDPSFGETSNQHGWHDPSLDGRFRLLEDGFRFDVLAGGSFGLDEASNGNRYGNNYGSNDFYYRGGPRLYLGAGVGQKLENLQWSVLAQVDHALEQDEDLVGNKLTAEERTDLSFGGHLLNNLYERRLFLRSLVALRFNSGYETQIKGEAEEGERPGMREYRLGTGLDYALTTDVLAQVNVTYREIFLQSGQIDDYHVWMWTVGARYQF